MINNGFLSFTIISLFEVRVEAIILNSVIIGMVGPCVIIMLERILVNDKSTQMNNILRRVLVLKNKHLYIVSGVIFLMILIPNIRHLTVGNFYLTNYLIYIPLAYI